MLRVLQCVNKMDRAGLETMLMNYYRNIDRTQVQFDFLTHRSDEGQYDGEIKALGGTVYHAPRLYPQNYFKYLGWMKTFFNEHPEYKIVHSHIDAMSYFPLLAAKKTHVPVRIAHSHSVGIEKDFKYPLKLLYRAWLPSVTTQCLACGKAAGEFLFGKNKFEIIANAIDCEEYKFDPEVRSHMRHQLGIREDALAVGHVGRFFMPKNHLFLIRIFEKLHEMKPNSVLILIGEGELQKAAKELTYELKLEDSVRFLGVRKDVPQLMQAMDLFLLPSLFEGVPLVGIEAQAAGLPILCSDKVPSEVNVTGNCSFMSLTEGTAAWANKSCRLALNEKQEIRRKTKMNGYDIHMAAPKLQQFYCQLIKECKG